MIFLKNTQLLPSFISNTINAKIVDEFFNQFPPATQIAGNVLSDNAGFDHTIPFSHNVLLIAAQKLINSNSVNKDTIQSILNILDYIDFKYALVFFIELSQDFTYDFLISQLEQKNNYVFLERLNSFLSVYTPEFLCIDNHDSLL